MTQDLEHRKLSFAVGADTSLAADLAVDGGRGDGRLLSTPPYAIHNAHGTVSDAGVVPERFS